MLLIPVIILIIFLIYKLAGFYYYCRARSISAGVSLSFFIENFGIDYQYKFSADGSMKYKWRKRFFTLKVRFNEEQELMNNIPRPFNFLSIQNSIVFY